MNPSDGTELRRLSYTEGEIDQMKSELPQRVAELINLENAKRQSNNEINAQIKTARKVCSDLVEKLRVGYHVVEEATETLVNTPVRGMKRTIWKSDSVTVRDVPMTPEECQGNLFEEFDPEALLRDEHPPDKPESGTSPEP